MADITRARFKNNVDTITGPNSMFIRRYRGRTFYFFGDEHSGSRNGCSDLYGDEIGKCNDIVPNFNAVQPTDSRCITLTALLHLWFLHNNHKGIKTDFYLEHSFTKDVRRRTAMAVRNEMNRRRAGGSIGPDDRLLDRFSWMTITELFMEPCFTKDKTLPCPYSPNVRVHYADVRTIDIRGERHIVDLFLIHDIRKSIEDSVSTGNAIDKLDELKTTVAILVTESEMIIRYLMSPSKYDELIDWLRRSDLLQDYKNKINLLHHMTVVRDGIRMHRIAAELLKLSEVNPVMAENIRLFIIEQSHHIVETEAREIIEFIGSIDDYIYSGKNISSMEAISIIGDLYTQSEEMLTSLSVLSMDAYTLARMMYHRDSTEVIAFTGSYHTDNYNRFFDRIEADILSAIPSEDSFRCIISDTLERDIPVRNFRNYDFEHRLQGEAREKLKRFANLR